VGAEIIVRDILWVKYAFVSGALSAFFYCSYVDGRIGTAVKAMVDSNSKSPLKSLHSDDSLSPAKLAQMDQRSSDELQLSLAIGRKDCLKTRLDGTILDGHHRIHILRIRGIDVDALPREIVPKED
jgi:hypothetical protein